MSRERLDGVDRRDRLPNDAPLRPSETPRSRRAVFVLTVVVVVALAVVVREPGTIDVPTAVVLGVIEGVTEFLPVSSTGHLTVAERLLDLHGSAADAYVIVIQAGAILAVVVLYRARLRTLAAGISGRDAVGRRVAVGLAIAFGPAALLGVALGDTIKSRLFGVGPVAGAWAVGGVLILVFSRRRAEAGQPLEHLAWRQAAMIGVAQAGALWPGVSRSLVTIIAASLVGLSLPAAVEFSFLLGFVTLGAATAFEAARAGPDIVDAYGLAAPVVGFVVAFAAAAASVRWMVAHLSRGTLGVFGYYRLAAGAAALILLIAGVV